jgi:hypothetical protein
MNASGKVTEKKGELLSLSTAHGSKVTKRSVPFCMTSRRRVVMVLRVIVPSTGAFVRDDVTWR